MRRIGSGGRPWMWAAWGLSGCAGDTSVVDGASSSTGADAPATTSSSADDETTGDAAPTLEFCAGAHEVRYDPDVPGLHAFPDDRWTSDDPDTDTGLALRSPLEQLAADDPARGFPSVFERAPTLDGFGVTAPMFLRVTGPVDPQSLPSPGDETDPTRSSLLLVDLDADPIAFVPFDWRLLDEQGFEGGGTTLVLTPLTPLRSGARHGVAMTRAATDDAGDCFAPGAAMQGILEGTTAHPELVRLAPGHAALLEALVDAGAIASPDELSAAIVYTTATTIRQSTAIARAISTSMPSPVVLGECFTPFGYPYVQCDAILRMVDFGDDDGIILGTEPQSTYDLPVVAFLPIEGEGPFPTIVFGHALTGDRTSAWIQAVNYAPLGFAMIAIDAPKHGEHPDAAVTNPTFDLLGLSNDLGDPFDPFAARDNFRQATFDKLQLVRRLVVGLDMTGDDEPDFDAAHLHYLGHSLGAAMGPQLLAYTDRVVAATLLVGGGNLTNIVAEASEFQPLIGLVTQDFSDDERARLLAVTQSMIDAGDPMASAPYVVRERIEGFDARVPHLLAQMALDDTVVPNSSTAYLTRALGIPIAGEAKVPMRGVEVLTDLPVQANFDGGVTAGLYQFDQMQAALPGVLEPATHRGLQGDPYAIAQQELFHTRAEELGGPAIIDPFAR